MAKYSMHRKLGRTTDQRKALLRNQVTALLYYGKIKTTEARAKEVRKLAESVIAWGVKECDNFDMVKVQGKVPVKDKDGRRVKEVVDGKRLTKYETVEKEIKKDRPSRLHARSRIMSVLYPVVDVPQEKAGRKRNTKVINMGNKLLDEIAPKYKGRNGGFTRMTRIGLRKGDAAMMVLLELV